MGSQLGLVLCGSFRFFLTLEKKQVQDVMKSDFLDVARRSFAVCSLTDGFICSAGVCMLTSHWVLLIGWY